MPNWDGRLGLVAFGMGMAILNDQYSAQPREMQVLTQSPLGTAAIRVEFFMGAMLLGILLTNLFGYDPQRMSRLVGVGCVPVSAGHAETGPLRGPSLRPLPPLLLALQPLLPHVLLASVTRRS